MKIGLLSPHYAYNYGAVLQAFALKHYLRGIGHDAVILNRRPAYQCAIPSLYGRIARKIEEFAKRNSFGVFEKKYLQPQTEPVIFPKDWNKVPLKDFDSVIVGSDQVWRDDYAFNSFGYNVFLDFLEGFDVRRISYAPSLGKESWEAGPKTEERVKRLLKEFSAISVRESSSINILQQKFGVKAELVLDPTMLLNASEYRSVFTLSNLEKGHIAAYILDYDSEFDKTLKEISNYCKLPVKKIAFSKLPSGIGRYISRFSPTQSVTKWLDNISSSEFVITNSFHGMVFSIIFRKQFLVFMNSERGAARFKSLLAMFGLEDRLVSHNQWQTVIDNKIDYNLIESLLMDWQNKSINFINTALAK